MKQTKVVYRLNHNIMALFTLNSDPELPISNLLALLVWQSKGALICPQT